MWRRLWPASNVRRIALLLVLGTAFAVVPHASAQQTSEAERSAPVPQTYRSKHFVLQTDLSAEEAKDLLERLETMLGYISSYWGRPHRGVIPMYVARDIDKWSRAALAKMSPEGIVSIQSRGGLTIGHIRIRGNAFQARSAVYAYAEPGIPQHEAVHAYCNNAFGGTGPVWYSEGMAEVGNYWIEGDKGVSTPQRVIDYLKNSPVKPLNDIVNNPLETTGDSWQNYAWRWALCHLLGHNENYTKRFKPLGLQLLNRKEIDFWQVYGAQAEEIEFEYHQFLNHMALGYRVDLCSWDWRTRFSAPRSGRSLVSKIKAPRGWQASRLLVSAETEYEYAAAGTWSIAEDAEPLTADGQEDGRGRLVGVIFDDYKLSEPFELGAFGTFTAPVDGKLYLRCRDDWGAIADNSGTVTVRLKEQGTGRPLVDPRAEQSEDSECDSAAPDE